MIKKRIYKDAMMVLGGVVLLFIAKGDPWPIGMYFYLYVCSAIGSVFGLYLSGKISKSFIIAVLIATLLLSLGLIIVDIFIEGIGVIYEYLMWSPVMLFFLPLYGLAGTLSMFPIVSFMIVRIKEKGKHSN